MPMLSTMESTETMNTSTVSVKGQSMAYVKCNFTKTLFCSNVFLCSAEHQVRTLWTLMFNFTLTFGVLHGFNVLVTPSGGEQGYHYQMLEHSSVGTGMYTCDPLVRSLYFPSCLKGGPSCCQVGPSCKYLFVHVVHRRCWLQGAAVHLRPW